MAATKMIFAGTGGQGVVLIGQMVSYAALYEDKQTTFFPSYGPEMRGGTANSTVIVSDKPIASPTVFEADCVIAMTLPSMVKFEKIVKPGGVILLNTTAIDKTPERTDIRVLEIPAAKIARELGDVRAANMVMLGAAIRATNVVSQATIEKVMREHAFTGAKAASIPLNVKAFEYFKG